MDTKDKKKLKKNILNYLLENKIFEGKTVSEVKLTKIFNVGRTPIREISKELQNENIIVSKQRKGLYLKKPSLKMIANIYDMRTVLEGLAIRLAVKRLKNNEINIENIKELEKFKDKYKKANEEKNYSKCRKYNSLIHTKIVNMSGNNLLIEIIDNFNIINNTFLISQSAGDLKLGTQTTVSHGDILKQIKNSKPEESEELIKKHIQEAKNELIERVVRIKMGL